MLTWNNPSGMLVNSQIRLGKFHYEFQYRWEVFHKFRDFLPILPPAISVRYSKLPPSTWQRHHFWVQPFRFEAATKIEESARHLFHGKFFELINVFSRSHIASQKLTNVTLRNDFITNDHIFEAKNPKRSMIWPFYYLCWNWKKRKDTSKSVNLFAPPMPLIVAQVSLKATMDSYAVKTEQFLDYCKSSNDIVFKSYDTLLLTTKTLAGQIGVTKMYAALRLTYYWPQMAANVTSVVREWMHCAKRRGCLRKWVNFLKIFLVWNSWLSTS